MVIRPDGVRTQGRLCWRGPAAIYQTGLEVSASLQYGVVVASGGQTRLGVNGQELRP
jgi:hypothetical protein